MANHDSVSDVTSEVDITDYCPKPTKHSDGTVELLEPVLQSDGDSDNTCVPVHRRPDRNHSSVQEMNTTSTNNLESDAPHPHYMSGGIAQEHWPYNITVTLSPVQSSIWNEPYDCPPPSHTQPEVTDGDIELACLPVQTPGTYSTDHLLPPLDEEGSDTETVVNDQQRNQSTDVDVSANVSDIQLQVPNYKPLSLRWPIQLLILATIAGMWVFLEYQVHDLPPLRFKALQFDALKHNKMQNLTSVTATSTSSNSHDSILQIITTASMAQPLPKMPSAVPTSTGIRALGTSLTTGVEPARAPMITGRHFKIAEARPPEASYVNPKGPVTAYCGWGRPQWNICTFYMDDYNWNPYYLWVVGLEELIPVFTTTDPSWCACTLSNGPWPVDSRGPGQWDRYFPVDRIWETDDDGCRSVMNLVASLNYYKVHTYTPFPQEYPKGDEVPWQAHSKAYKEHWTGILNSYYGADVCTLLTTPPSSISPFWPYPITESTDDILVPLEVRNPWLEGQDVFGNDIEHARDTIASFPVKFRWGDEGLDERLQAMKSRTHLSEGGPVFACSTDVQDYLGKRGKPRVATCPAITSSHQTTWWTLPLRNPTYAKSSSRPSTTIRGTYPDPPGLGSSNPTDRIDISTESSQESIGVTRTTQDEIDTQTPEHISSEGTTEVSSLKDKTPIASESSPDHISSTITTELSTRKDELTANPESSLEGTEGETSTTLSSQNDPSTGDAGRDESSKTVNPTRQPQQGDLIPIAVNTTQTQVITHNSFTNLKTTAQPRPTSSNSSEPLHIVFWSGTSAITTITTPLSQFPAVSKGTFVALIKTVSGEDHQHERLTTELVSITTMIPPESRTTNTSEPLRIVFWSGPSALTTVTTRLAQFPSASKGTYAAIIKSSNILPDFKVTELVSIPTTPLPSSNITSTPTYSIIIRPPSTSLPGPISPEIHDSFFNLRTEADFLMVSLVPVLLATIVGIPIQIFVSSVNSILPFRALRHIHHRNGGGASAEDSLCLPRSTWLAPWIGYRFIRNFGDSLPFLAALLDFLSIMLVPLSTEMIRMEFTSSDCGRDKHVCAYGLRKVTTPIRAVEGILGAMTILVLVMGYIIFRWRSGFATHPWSIASMAALLANSEPEVQDLLRKMPRFSSTDTTKHLTASQVVAYFSGYRFQLGFHGPSSRESNNISGTWSYGIRIVPPVEDTIPIKPTTRDPPNRKSKSNTTHQGKKTPPFWRRILSSTSVQHLIVQIITLIFTTGLLILILYYENTILPDTAFERFMDSQSFGVRILFTSFGTVLGLLWNYHFSQIAETHVYHSLSKGPQSAHTILLSPPSNIFLGIWQFASPRQVLRRKDDSTSTSNNFLALNIATATFLAKFVSPILLSNIPFRNTVTWKMHEACTWGAVAVLSYMLLVLVGFVIVIPLLQWQWRTKGRGNERLYMPVRGDTVAGCMYYLVMSDNLLGDLKGLDIMMGREERDRLVGRMGRRFFFGDYGRCYCHAGVDAGAGQGTTCPGGAGAGAGAGAGVGDKALAVEDTCRGPGGKGIGVYYYPD